MSVFEIGDKVFSPSWGFSNECTDMILTITEMSPESTLIEVQNEVYEKFFIDAKYLKHLQSFNVGDEVVVHKPKIDIHRPSWVHQMDRYDGQTMTVRHVFGDGKRMRLENCDGYAFNPSWCESVEIKMEFPMEIGDFLG